MFTVRRYTHRPRYTAGNSLLGIDRYKGSILAAARQVVCHLMFFGRSFRRPFRVSRTA